MADTMDGDVDNGFWIHCPVHIAVEIRNGNVPKKQIR